MHRDSQGSSKKLQLEPGVVREAGMLKTDSLLLWRNGSTRRSERPVLRGVGSNPTSSTMKFEPTKEQIAVAQGSYRRYMMFLRAIFYTPREWAVMCLQNEWATGGPVNW